MARAPHFLSPLLRRRAGPASLRVASTGTLIAARLELAGDSASRTRGLLGRAVMPPDLALAIAPCWAVHTFGMRFPIDVLFVRRDGTVLKTATHVPASRISACWRAFATIECAAGVLATAKVAEGDQVIVVGADTD